MNPRPSGELRQSSAGRDLILVRAFDAKLDEVWAMLTESDRTGLWFATWEGEAAAGNTIEFTMTFEQGATAQKMTIVACEPPRHLEVQAADEYGSWHLEINLVAQGAGTSMQFTHHLDASAKLGEIGPGWEYYLDNLMAAHQGSSLPNFDDYFPSQQPFYEMLERS